jgi:hypothetical protein
MVLPIGVEASYLSRDRSLGDSTVEYGNIMSIANQFLY